MQEGTVQVVRGRAPVLLEFGHSLGQGDPTEGGGCKWQGREGYYEAAQKAGLPIRLRC